MGSGGFNVGGEQSGHIILSDHVTTGDGIVSALQVLAAVHRANKPASEICHRFEKIPQILRNVKLPRKPSHEEIATISRVSLPRLGNMGRLLVRPSGIEDFFRIMAEGEHNDVVEGVIDDITSELHRVSAIAA